MEDRLGCKVSGCGIRLAAHEPVGHRTRRTDRAGHQVRLAPADMAFVILEAHDDRITGDIGAGPEEARARELVRQDEDLGLQDHGCSSSCSRPMARVLCIGGWGPVDRLDSPCARP